MNNNILLLTDESFDATLLAAGKPVLVDFTATWAAPCQELAPALSTFAANTSDLAVAKIDVGGEANGAPADNPATFERFDIRVFPTLLLFRDGKVAGMSIGAMDEDKLKNWTQEILRNPPKNDIAPENFRAYSAQFYKQLENAQLQHIVKLSRKVTLGVSASELAGAGLLTALAGPFGAAVAAPTAVRAVWQGAQALRHKETMPQPVGNKALSLLFNLSASATGMALVMAPAANIGIKAACVVAATYFMATGGLRLFNDIGNLFKRPSKDDAQNGPTPPAL